MSSASNTSLKGLRAFLSGPMSDDEHLHVNDFMDAHRRLQALGVTHIYNPAFEYVRGLAGGAAEQSHERYMLTCVHELTRMSPDGLYGSVERMRPYYDVLVCLDGWEGSAGSSAERFVAQACGIRIVEIGEVEGMAKETEDR